MAAVAVLLAVSCAGVAVVGLGSALVARQRLIDAADAAALAAADAASGAAAGVPCDLAGAVAGAAEATVVVCRVDGGVASVRVTALVLGVAVSASARAGPPEPADGSLP